MSDLWLIWQERWWLLLLLTTQIGSMWTLHLLVHHLRLTNLQAPKTEGHYHQAYPFSLLPCSVASSCSPGPALIRAYPYTCLPSYPCLLRGKFMVTQTPPPFGSSVGSMYRQYEGPACKHAPFDLRAPLPLRPSRTARCCAAESPKSISSQTMPRCAAVEQA